jgi:hypothetical protein
MRAPKLLAFFAARSSRGSAFSHPLGSLNGAVFAPETPSRELSRSLGRRISRRGGPLIAPLSATAGLALLIAAGVVDKTTSDAAQITAVNPDVPPAKGLVRTAAHQPVAAEPLATLVGARSATGLAAAAPAELHPSNPALESSPKVGHQPPELRPRVEVDEPPPAPPAQIWSVTGTWSQHPSACSKRIADRDGLLVMKIDDHGARAGNTSCRFSRLHPEGDGWRALARCSSPDQRWISNIRLLVNENKLTWKSERGSQAYVRCGALIAAR